MTSLGNIQAIHISAFSESVRSMSSLKLFRYTISIAFMHVLVSITTNHLQQ